MKISRLPRRKASEKYNRRRKTPNQTIMARLKGKNWKRQAAILDRVTGFPDNS